MKTRTEFDSIGSLEIPVDAYYGVQSLRAKQLPYYKETYALWIHKQSCSNKEGSCYYKWTHWSLNYKIANVISIACDEIINGKFHDQFIVDAVQGGAGTSANMNANEVIANRAIELLGCTKGDYTVVHPNDHVNMAQSTNDVIPTAGKLTILKLMPHLLNELEELYSALILKSRNLTTL